MEILKPGAAGYEEGRRVFNGMIDRRPALIALCETEDDVRAALDRAARDGLPVSVRGGGHNVAGHGIGEGSLVIHLGRMRHTEVDAGLGIAHAQGGATWGDFDAATQAHGLATPGGIVSTTGLAGLTLGGGIGVLRGKHGLTCDNLVGARLVTAGGDLAEAGADADPELVWALRGGGGNFGIVTNFDLAVHPQGEVVSGPIEFAYDDPAGFLRFYREYTAALPDEMSADVLLRSGADAVPRITLLTCWSGDPEQADAVYAPLRARGPINDAVARRPYVDAQRTYDAISPWGQRNYWKSNGMAELSDAAIEVLVAACDARRSPLAQVQLEHLHGQVHRTDPASAAVGFHGATYNLLFNAKWLDPARDDENIAWTRDSFDQVQPHLAGGAYVNYLLAEPEERIRAAYGPEVYDRLARVKARYDPDNVFRLNQNIRPAF